MLEEDISKDQDEMNEQFMEEYTEASISGDFETFAENWGLDVDEAHGIALEFPQISDMVPEDFTKSETDQVSTNTNPNEQATMVAEKQMDEWENGGVTSEIIPGETGVSDMIMSAAEKLGIPPEAALALAGVVKKNPKDIVKGTKGMFTPKMTKKNLPDKRGTKSGEVVGEPTKGGLPVKHKEQGLAVRNEQGLAKTTNGETRKFGLTDRNKELATAGTLTGAVIADRMLSGDRNSQGDFIEGPKEKVDLYQPDGIEQPEEKPETAPEVKSENQNGYHKLEGQNFWTVDNEDSYWDTHEIGTGDMDGSELKQAKAKEVDFSSWFN